MPGRKSDVKDAQWIAKLLHKGLLRGSLIPCTIIRQLRTYSRRFVKMQGMITRVTQEMERILEMCNIRITSLMSNNHGVNIQKVIEKIIAGQDSVEELVSLVQRDFFFTDTYVLINHSFNTSLKISFSKF
jgi:hypothetical protein